MKVTLPLRTHTKVRKQFVPSIKYNSLLFFHSCNFYSIIMTFCFLPLCTDEHYMLWSINLKLHPKWFDTYHVTAYVLSEYGLSCTLLHRYHTPSLLTFWCYQHFSSSLTSLYYHSHLPHSLVLKHFCFLHLYYQQLSSSVSVTVCFRLLHYICEKSNFPVKNIYVTLNAFYWQITETETCTYNFNKHISNQNCVEISGSHSSKYKDNCLLEYCTMLSSRNCPIFQRWSPWWWWQ